MNTYYSFVFVFILSVCLIQSFATKLEKKCGDANATCMSTDECCVGLKCYYAQPGIKLEGFCESPALAEKANKIELKSTINSTTGVADSTTTTRLRQNV